MDTGVLEQLRNVPIFRDIDEEEAAGVYRILDGDVSVDVNGVERARPRNRRHSGERSLTDGEPASATVKAESPTTTFALTSWHFLPLLDERLSITRALVVEPSGRLRRVESDPAG